MMDFGTFNASLLSTHPILVTGLIFLLGIFSSFSPCVYPTIPLVLGVVGARSAGSKSKGFFLSFCYVLGMALTYAVLGFVAAKTGQLFGQFSSGPLAYFIVASITLLFGLAIVTDFTFPQITVFPKQAHRKRDGFFGVFVMGLFSGLIVAPCMTPVLGVLLSNIAESKSGPVLGFVWMFVYGCGLGFLYILAGTFAGLLVALPKSGPWLKHLHQLFAWFLILFAGYLFYMGGMRL